MGLGDDPGVPRLARPRAEGRQRHPVHADGVADDVRDGAGGGEVAAGDRSGAQGDAAPAARGDGGRPRRVLDPAPRARTRCRPTSTARRWSPTRWSTRTSCALAEVLAERDEGSIQITQAEGSLKVDYAFLEQLAEVAQRPVLYNVVTVAAERRPTCTASRWPGSRSAGAKGLPIFAQCATGRAGFAFTLEHWNLYDASPAWRAVTTGTKADKIEKMQDPELRTALVAEAEEADRRLRAIQAGVGGDPAGLVVQGVGRQQDLAAVRRAQRRRDRRGGGQAPDRGDARPVAGRRPQRRVPRPGHAARTPSSWPR